MKNKMMCLSKEKKHMPIAAYVLPWPLLSCEEKKDTVIHLLYLSQTCLRLVL